MVAFALAEARGHGRGRRGRSWKGRRRGAPRAAGHVGGEATQGRVDRVRMAGHGGVRECGRNGRAQRRMRGGSEGGRPGVEGRADADGDAVRARVGRR
jgi:hypothetical protein